MANENRNTASFELFNLIVQEKLATIAKNVSQDEFEEIFEIKPPKSDKMYDYYVRRLTNLYTEQWENIITTYNLKSKYEILQNCVDKYSNSTSTKWRPPLGDPKHQYQDLYFEATTAKKKLLENELAKLQATTDEAKKQLQLKRKEFITKTQIKLKTCLQKCDSNIVQIENETKIMNVFK